MSTLFRAQLGRHRLGPVELLVGARERVSDVVGFGRDWLSLCYQCIAFRRRGDGRAHGPRHGDARFTNGARYTP